MTTSILNNVIKTLEVTRLVYLDGDAPEVNEALALKGRDLSTLDDRKLSEYIYVLSKHAAFVQLHFNTRYMKYLESKRQYEVALNRSLAKLETSSKTPLKEKTALAMQDEEVSKLYDLVREDEYHYILLDKMPAAILEIVNALKKEASLRERNR